MRMERKRIKSFHFVVLSEKCDILYAICTLLQVSRFFSSCAPKYHIIPCPRITFRTSRERREFRDDSLAFPLLHGTTDRRMTKEDGMMDENGIWRIELHCTICIFHFGLDAPYDAPRNSAQRHSNPKVGLCTVKFEAENASEGAGKQHDKYKLIQCAAILPVVMFASG